MDRDSRIGVFLETVTICKQGFYYKDSAIVMIPTIGKIPSKFYKDEMHPSVKEIFDTVIDVKNQDCLYAAKELLDNGFKPAVLNMASGSMPCGGVLKGSGAQEENISRRSNLFQTLYKYHPIGKDFEIPQNEKNEAIGISYPLDFNFGGIYSQGVVVFRNGEETNYDVLNNPFKIDVITVPAVKRPPYDKNFHLAPSVIETEKNKIRTIFNIAIDNNNDSLVLGAFGCGAFKTPPAEMARLFHEVINEEPYRKRFKKIIFAILDDKNSHKEHNPEGNFKPFYKEFHKENTK